MRWEREWERMLRCRHQWFDEEIDGLKKVDDRWSMVGMRWERQRIQKARASKGRGLGKPEHREREWERMLQCHRRWSNK